MPTPHMTMRSVRQIRANKRNARTHPKKQIKQICHSVSRFGFTSPVVVDENDNIIAGHGRYLAAMELGLTEIPVLIVSHLSDLKSAPSQSRTIKSRRTPDGTGLPLPLNSAIWQTSYPR